MKKIDIRPNDVLVIIDPQNDFCPGGALAIAGGDEIMKGIAALAERFDHVVVSQDWHPADHKSFASNHAGKAPFDQIEMHYGTQTLWPDHCVQGSEGADWHPDIAATVLRAEAIIRKGMNTEVDSYSAFTENDQVTATGLGGYLRSKGIKRCFFVGLAYDFCVAYSAVDAARNEGLQAVVVKDLCRAIAMPLDGTTTVEVAEESFRINNVTITNKRGIA